MLADAAKHTGAKIDMERTSQRCDQVVRQLDVGNPPKYYRYSNLKSYGASEKLRIESYAAPITPHRKLRRPRPLPYTPSYPPCASGRHGARSAPQGLSYTTRRQKGWMIDAFWGNFSSDAASVYRADRALNRLVLPC